MKSPLVLAVPLLPIACAGAEPPPQAPTAPPVVVDLSAPPAPRPAPTAKKALASPADPSIQAKLPDAKDVRQFGMIGVLRSDSPAAPWGKDDVLAKGNMWGDEIGDSFGAGGLGLSGVGPGGGGRGEGIGLGSIGGIGHGAGTGYGFGSGRGRLGGSRRNPPKIRMGATQVNGRLPPEVIQRIVRQNFGRFRLCYDKGFLSKPDLQGRVSVRFVIDKDGSVTSVANAGSDLPSVTTVACVTRAFRGLSFPQPEGGKVIVTYPIVFSPGDPPPPRPDSGTAPTTTSSTAPAAPAKKP